MCMRKVLENVLKVDGTKRVKLSCSLDEKIPLGVYVPDYVLRCASHLVDARQGVVDGSLVTELEYPVLGPVQILQGDGMWRMFFVVHRHYGRGVSDCIRVAVDGMQRLKRDAQFAYVRNYPSGIEIGKEAHGVMLFEADWMLENCIAVR